VRADNPDRRHDSRQGGGVIEIALLCVCQKSLQRWSLKRQVKTRLAAVERLGFLR